MTEHEVRAPELENRRFGRYRIRMRLAHGGMASVYLAQLSGVEGFTKWLAIKIIHPHLADDRTLAQMFLHEARLTARLDHPNICTVFDFGEQDRTYFLAMEYLEGEALSTVLRSRDGPLSYSMSARIAVDVAAALDYAHELRTADGGMAGVVHRDVSPQNIFVLYGGTVKLVDFGIARTDEYVAERTETGSLRGKLAYMSPEQVRRKKLDRRADIFALGAVLWEMSVGQRLFRRDSDDDTLGAVMREPIPTPSSVVKDYPPALEAIVMRALARDPDQRYATAAEMARDLNDTLRALGGAPTSLEITDFMTGLFAEKIQQRRELLRSLSSAHASTKAVAASDDPAEMPTRPGETPASLDRADASLPHTEEALNPPEHSGAVVKRHGSRVAIAVSLVVGILVASGVWVVASGYTRHGSADHPVPHAAVLAHTTPPPVPPSTQALAAPNAAAAPAVVTVAPLAAEPATAAGRTSQDATGRRSPRQGHAHHGAHEHDAANAHTESPSNATGALDVAAIPSATVYEHGRSLGYTPLRGRQLSAGRHVLRLVPTDGRPARTVTVDIRAGETTSTSVRFP